MLSIVCVKIGKKYSSKYVDRLLLMCKKSITHPFNFFCYTDDPSNLPEEVKVIPFVDNDIDVIVHNKLFLFSEYVDAILGEGPRVFFDLDIVISSNIDHIVLNNDDFLTVIKAQWRIIPPEHIQGHNLNSSCMTWRHTTGNELWEHFSNNFDKFTILYREGMDYYLYHEFFKQGKLNTFPLGLFRSHLFGFDYRLNDPDYRYGTPSGKYHAHKVKHLFSTFPITLLNGPVPEDVCEQVFRDYAI